MNSKEQQIVRVDDQSKSNDSNLEEINVRNIIVTFDNIKLNFSFYIFYFLLTQTEIVEQQKGICETDLNVTTLKRTDNDNRAKRENVQISHVMNTKRTCQFYINEEKRFRLYSNSFQIF